MKNLRSSGLIVVLTLIYSNLVSIPAANAQASEKDEIRYIKAVAEHLYEQNRDEDFSVQELLDDGYEMCKKIAQSGTWENLAQDAIRSGLGLGGSQPQNDNQEIARLADKYLCDS